MATTTSMSPLALQVPDAVHAHLRAAIVAIDSELGSGYAKSHPDVLGAFLEACSTFYEAEVLREQGDKSG